MSAGISRVSPATRLAMSGVLVLFLCGSAAAQVTPAAGSTPPDDTPSVKLGGVIFADYTYTASPETVTELNTFNPSSFNLTRAYLNVTGNISHLISYRITPDIKQETKLAEGDLKGNYIWRLKYAYGQLNLDDWLPKGSFARLGMQPTPYCDFADAIYRYRFQGKGLPDREKILSTADAGLAARVMFPGNYGEVAGGYYNGEGYETPELNDQKAIQVRISVRPTPMTPVLKGLRLSGFVVSDSPTSGGKRDRGVGLLTFEHDRVNAGIEYTSAKDQVTSATTENTTKGWSVWVTPKLGKGFEALLRYDEVEPSAQGPDARHKRTIAGIAYWLPVQKGVTTAILLDYDGVKYDDYTKYFEDNGVTRPDDKKYALHTLFQF